MVYVFVYLCVCMQGERGEPGFVIGADGSMTSGLAGPVGPKGVKVIFVVTVFLDPDHFTRIVLLSALTMDI